MGRGEHGSRTRGEVRGREQRTTEGKSVREEPKGADAELGSEEGPGRFSPWFLARLVGACVACVLLRAGLASSREAPLAINCG